MEFLQLCLKGLEVADGLLKDRVWAQGLQLHEVTTDVVKTHVSEATSAKNKTKQLYNVCKSLGALFFPESFKSHPRKFHG